MRRLIGSAVLVLANAVMPAAHAADADAIWFGGPIVTMNDAAPEAEAIAVKDGRVVAVGARSAVMDAEQGPATHLHDLQGRTLVPGFIDPHSHFIDSLTMADRANVAQPPVGPARDPDEIVAVLREFAARQGIEPGGLIVGSGYDDNLMPPGQLLTRDVLDAAFPDNPVVIVHTTMHGAVLNSAAFAKYGYADGMPTPPSSTARRTARARSSPASAPTWSCCRPTR